VLVPLRLRIEICSLSSGGGEADGDLEGVIDIPLETSEGTNHDDTGAKTVPESLEPDLGVDLTDLLASWLVALTLVEDRDHSVSGVRHDSAEDTGPVSGEEGDHELGALGVRALWGGEDVGVESLHGVLESAELDHGVWDLSEPEWSESLVETVPALLVHDGRPSLAGGGWEGTLVSSLHSNFECFHWAEHSVSDDLSAGGRDQETNSLVLGGLLTEGTSVDVLEHFVESEFTKTLHTVSDESWEPSQGEALEALFGHDGPESVWNALVESWVCLFSALDDIKWADGGVRKAAGENASYHALSVVAHVVDVTHCFVLLV